MDFSIIIPAKNEEKNIQNCLQSIAEIDYPADKYEVLLVDNGSTDKTVEVAESFGARVFVQPDLTISGLRNYGANQAKGKILAFLDADCTVDKNWLIAASIYLEDAQIVAFGSPAILPLKATWVQRSWFSIRKKKQQVEDVDWHESANVFIRSDAFNSVGGFNEDLKTCEDYDLSFRLHPLGRLISDSRIIAVHHREPATISEFFSKESWRGQSNFSGLLQHGFHWKELPSLLIPIVYLICIVITILVGLALLCGATFFTLNGYLAWLLVWQFPLLVLAFYKGSSTPEVSLKFGLYLLLNIYFLARARAMLRPSLG